MYFSELMHIFQAFLPLRFLTQSRSERQVAFVHILPEPSYTEAFHAFPRFLECEPLGVSNIMLGFI